MHTEILSLILLLWLRLTLGARILLPLTAAASSTLPASVLLGWDVPQLMDYVQQKHTTSANKGDALAVMTRSKQRQEESEAETPAQTSSIPETDGYLSNLDDSVFSPAGPSKPTMTRAQKRENRQQYRHKDVDLLPVS